MSCIFLFSSVFPCFLDVLFSQILPLNQAIVIPKHQVFIDFFKERNALVDRREIMDFYTVSPFADRNRCITVLTY